MMITYTEAIKLMHLAGVNLTHDILKRKYRELALRYHPDKNPNGGSTFVDMKNAYDYLTEFLNKTPPKTEAPKPKTEAPKPKEPKKERRPNMCSWCFTRGYHNRRSCPKKLDEECILNQQIYQQEKIIEKEMKKLEELKVQKKKFQW